MNQFFSPSEIARYNRHFILPGFGEEAQRLLKNAKVLVIGAGGLGSPLLLYLAAAGVGTIGIVDYDIVEESNLQRQVLFGTAFLGSLKTQGASDRIEALNPHVQVEVHPVRLNSHNALSVIKDYDVVADGSDNFPTRYLVNDACVLLGKPNVFASIFQFEGQLSVFNYTDRYGHTGPNYRDLYPEPPAPGTVASCAEGGVLGVLPGILGSMQALEVIKIITGTGDPLSGKYFTFNALNFESHIFFINKRLDNPVSGINPTITALIDYDQFCGTNSNDDMIKEITAGELKQLQFSGEPIQIVDVREQHEYDQVNIGGDLLPLKTIAENAVMISRNKKVIIHCEAGSRSALAVRELQNKFGFTNLFNLKGGIRGYLDLREEGVKGKEQ